MCSQYFLETSPSNLAIMAKAMKKAAVEAPAPMKRRRAMKKAKKAKKAKGKK